MKKILYVSAFVPEKDAGHAGGRVAYENLTRLQAEGAVSIVVCTSEPSTPAQDGGHCVVRQTRLSLLRYLASNALTLPFRTIATSPILHTRLNVHAERAIADLLRGGEYEDIFVDFTQCLLPVFRAIAISAKKIRVTACLHDIFAQRIIRSHRLVDTALTGWICREERELILSLDRVLVLSVKDQELVRSLYSVHHVEVKPFTPPAWCVNVDRSDHAIDPGMLVFFGNFDRHENSSAANWFVANALPVIRSELPNASLKLVGTGSDALAARLNIPEVTGTGFVSDPSETFSRCAFAIAPLSEGAGVKFKVLEALASGVPVLGTAVACEGIPAQPLLHQAEKVCFADEAIRLLKAQRRLSTAA